MSFSQAGCLGALLDSTPPAQTVHDLLVISSQVVRPMCGDRISAETKLPTHAYEASRREPLPITAWDSMVGGFPLYHTLVLQGLMDSAVLQRSLEATLQYFPQFAGRLRKRRRGAMEMEVVCNNAGCTFLTATCSTPLADFLPPKGLQVFTPMDMQPAYKRLTMTAPTLLSCNSNVPLLSIMLLKAAGGGCCLVLGMSHLLGDHRSLRNFMAHWAATTRQHLAQQATTPLTPHSSDASKLCDNEADDTVKRNVTSPVTAEGCAANQHAPQTAASKEVGCHKSVDSTESPPTPLPGALPACYPVCQLAALASTTCNDEEHANQAPKPQQQTAPAVIALDAQQKAYPTQHFQQAKLTSLLGVIMGMAWHTQIRDQIVPLTVVVGRQRLAELKALATEELELAGWAGPCARPASGGTGATMAGCGVEKDVSGTMNHPKSQSSPIKPPWVSTNDALIARIWQVLGSLPPREKQEFGIDVCVDCRGYLTPSLPPAFMGNIVAPAITPLLNAGSLSLGELAANVRSAIDIARGSLPHAMAMCTAFPPGSLMLPASSYYEPTASFAATNWDWEPSNELDFGWGVPLWQQGMLAVPASIIIISPDLRKVDGVVVQLFLHGRVAKAVKQWAAAGNML